MRAPIQSEKHEVSWSNLAQDASSVIPIQICKGQTPLNVSVGNEDVIGVSIRWFYFEFQFSAETITNTKIIHWQFVRRPADNVVGIPSTYYTADKRFIIKRGMEMLPKDVNHVIKRVFSIKVPKHLQRLGRDDVWEFQYIATSAETINSCGFAIYRPIS